jgi:TatD DNase family protein
MIDIGANLAHDAFSHDLEAALQRAIAAGVTTIVVTGTSLEGSRAAAELAADRAPVLYATAGVHPHEASHFTDETLAGLRALAAHPAVKSLGECGLDYHRNYSPRAAQLHAFEAQLELAAALHRPLFLHDRDALPWSTASPARARSCTPTSTSTCTSASPAGSATSGAACTCASWWATSRASG